MSLSDSEEESNVKNLHWNNWKPKEKSKTESVRSFIKQQKTEIPSSSHNTYNRLQNWVPPKRLSVHSIVHKLVNKKTKPNETNLLQNDNQTSITLDAANQWSVNDKETKSPENDSCLDLIEFKERENDRNENWGPLCPLHDMSQISEGSILFGILERSFLEKAKVWRDENGTLFCLGEGEANHIMSSEKSVVHIIDLQVLRKFLLITISEWRTLMDLSAINDVTLTFDVKQKFEESKLTHLEKLWYIVCKRRHCLPAVKVKAKYVGFVKLNNVWKILPKLVIEDIRDLNNDPIP